MRRLLNRPCSVARRVAATHGGQKRRALLQGRLQLPETLQATARGRPAPIRRVRRSLLQLLLQLAQRALEARRDGSGSGGHRTLAACSRPTVLGGTMSTRSERIRQRVRKTTRACVCALRLAARRHVERCRSHASLQATLLLCRC